MEANAMSTLNKAVDDFLAQRRIAVAGVSRNGDLPANLIYRKLRGAGYQVFAINPKATTVEGDPCYPDLKSIPGGVDAVMIATHPDVTPAIVRQCHDLGIKRVWMHRSIGNGSLSDEGIRLCREFGISMIPGNCPMMYVKPVDFGHKCMKWMMRITGKQPEPIMAQTADSASTDLAVSADHVDRLPV
jgi:predicted CoA-binding protein